MHYWGYLREAGTQEATGAAFFLNRRFAITPNHCVDDPLPAAGIEIAPAVDSVAGLEVEVLRRDTDHDLALLYCARASSPIPSSAIHFTRGDEWTAPYRPLQSDPALSGRVMEVDLDFECEGGAVLHALQLESAAELGDYNGYSGSPVERPSGAPEVGGILIEQNPDRQDHHRKTNVLFAIPLAEVFRLFEELSAPAITAQALDPFVHPTSLGTRAGTLGSTALVTQKATDVLTALRELADQGLIPDEVRLREASRVARALVDQAMGLTS